MISVIILLVVVRISLFAAKRNFKKTPNRSKNTTRSYAAWERSRRMRYS